MTKNSDVYGDPLPKKERPKSDKYVKAVRKQLKQRSERGINKYGVTLERGDLSIQDWLQHLQEELMDAALYVERLKDSYAEEKTSKKSTRDLG